MLLKESVQPLSIVLQGAEIKQIEEDIVEILRPEAVEHLLSLFGRREGLVELRYIFAAKGTAGSNWRQQGQAF